MAVLTTKARKKLPRSKFALSKGRYPVDTKARAANAKARATQMVKAGKLSSAQRDKIFAAANRALGKKAGRKKAK